LAHSEAGLEDVYSAYSLWEFHWGHLLSLRVSLEPLTLSESFSGINVFQTGLSFAPQCHSVQPSFGAIYFKTNFGAKFDFMWCNEKKLAFNGYWFYPIILRSFPILLFKIFILLSRQSSPNLTTVVNLYIDQSELEADAGSDLGSTLRNSISAENFSDYFSSSNFGLISTQK
jgi:hypothetical protein